MSTSKTIVITGASQGIGAGLVNTFAGRGYNVVATSRSVSRSSEIPASDKVVRVDGDIADPATARKVVETALSRFGRIDALVNNAGIFFAKPFVDYTLDDYRKLAATNVEGFLHLTQLVVRQMVEQKNGGCIVSITTPLISHPIAGMPVSVAMITKGGIEAASKNIAMEYARDGIRVNTVAPGVVDTPLHKDNPKDFLKTLFADEQHFERAGDRRCGRLPDRGSAYHRGGAARRRRRTSGQMVTPVHAQAAGAEQRLKDLDITLPPPPMPFGAYVEAVQIGRLLFLSGMLPVVDRKTQFIGRLGGELSVEEGRKAAELAALSALAAVREHLGSLDKVTGVAKLGVYIATAGDFRDHPKVADGASEVLLKVFGPEMLSGRVVLGVASLPLGLPVEVELVLEVAA